MTRHVLFGVFTAIVLLGTSARADATGTIGWLQLTSSNAILVGLSGGANICTPSGGSPTSPNFALAVPGTQGVTTEVVRNWLSLLTAAKLAGKTVQIRTFPINSNGMFCVISDVIVQ